MNLSELNIGETAIIDSFTDEEMSIKLLEMGCLPGQLVHVNNIAPFGDPMAITISGYKLSLRKKEASTIILK